MNLLVAVRALFKSHLEQTYMAFYSNPSAIHYSAHEEAMICFQWAEHLGRRQEDVEFLSDVGIGKWTATVYAMVMERKDKITRLPTKSA